MVDETPKDDLVGELRAGFKDLFEVEATDEQITKIIKIMAGDSVATEPSDLLSNIGGLTDDECTMLADHNQSEAWIAERMISETLGENQAKWEGIRAWRRERMRTFKEMSALESQAMEQAQENRTGETDG